MVIKVFSGNSMQIRSFSKVFLFCFFFTYLDILMQICTIPYSSAGIYYLNRNIMELLKREKPQINHFANITNLCVLLCCFVLFDNLQ